MTNEDLLVQVKLFADHLNIPHDNIVVDNVYPKSYGLSRDEDSGWHARFMLATASGVGVLAQLYAKDGDLYIATGYGSGPTVEEAYATALKSITRRYPKPWID